MGNIACCTKSDGPGNPLDAQFSRKDFLGIKTHSVLRDYTMEKKLGFGAFGEVRLGVHKRSKVQTAIKKI